MPQMWSIRLQWESSASPSVSEEKRIVAAEDDALPEMLSAIQNDVVPTLGESLNIRATRIGELRGTP